MKPPHSNPPPMPPGWSPSLTQLDRIEAKLDALLDALEGEADDAVEDCGLTLDGDLVPPSRSRDDPL